MIRVVFSTGLGIVVLLAAVLIYTASLASTVTVTNNADSGPGSLRAAVAAANPGDAINFSSALSGQTITLTSGEIVIDKNLTISGPGSGVTISGNNASRIFTIAFSYTVNMSKLTLTKGSVLGSLADGGALSINGTLNLDGMVVTDNHADRRGGGAVVSGQLNLNRSTFSLNDAGEVSDPTMGDGGAIYANGGIFSSTAAVVSIEHSAIVNNSALHFGGGVFADEGGFAPGADVHITNSTLSGNFAEEGSTIFSNVTLCPICGPPLVDLLYDTVAASFSGAGSAVDFAHLTATIVAKQTSGANCVGTVSHGYNLDDDNSCGLSQPGDHPLGAVTLGPLAINPPGTTAMHALLAGDALQAVPPAQAGCGAPINTDQRGVFRPTGAGCEIGAYEVGASLACFALTGTPTPTPFGLTPPPPTNTPTDTATPRPTRTPRIGTVTVTPASTPCATVFGGGAGTPAPSPSPVTVTNSPTPGPATPTGLPTPRPTRTPHG